MKAGPLCSLTLGLVLLAGAGASATRERHLSLEARVAAQLAIARIRHAHQIDASTPFSRAFPKALAERSVRDDLKGSAALERFWRRPVTRRMLRAEVDRMIRETRMPGRLNELFAALGHDRILIEECLARPLLVDRLTRNYFAFDRTIHAGARSAIEAIHGDLQSGVIDPHADHPGRTVTELKRVEAGRRFEVADRRLQRLRAGPNDPREVELSPDEFATRVARLPEEVGAVGAIEEERDRFVVPVVLAKGPDRAQIARYTIAKRPWHDWWREVEGELDDGLATTAITTTDDPDAGGHPSSALPDRIDPLVPDGSSPSCGADDTWSAIPGSFPIARWDHSAVWTGERMIVWGGYDGTWFDDGGRYDPATETWSPISTVGAPSARAGHGAVWTGSEMLVWGGGNGTVVDTGGRYDPMTDTWSPMSTTGAPAPRRDHSAIWTGTRMVVWGGADDAGVTGVTLASGGRYDPVSDSWEPTSMVGAPRARRYHSTIWTGDEMIVWGGDVDSYVYLDTGGRYDPTLDTWSAVSMVNAPSARRNHGAVWTGDEMIVWGGEQENFPELLGDGARYDPLTNTWTPLPSSGAPDPMWRGLAAVWTGDRMLVWGGTNATWPDGSVGAAYDPVLDSWSSLSTLNAPLPSARRPVIWTGSEIIIWGGLATFSLHTGGRYDPAADVWTPIGPDNPTRREWHSTVWTGSQMIVWGGYRGTGSGWVSVDTGARYDPVTHDWTPTSLVGAPEYRDGHTAVWTGDEMIIWGGGNSGIMNTGGRYDPLSDTWQPTSRIGAPAERAAHTAFWTGDRMIVWGGLLNSWSDIDLGDGGSYDPATDSWGPLSSVDAPAPRWGQTGVWTGDTLIVWGGHDGADLDTGGRYDPLTDSWTPTTTTGAPAARRLHQAVWLGDRMILWGGGSGPVGYDVDAVVDSGARYDPVTDSWTRTSQAAAPFARYSHTAVLAGDRMLVWGGRGVDYSEYYDDGGAYCACAAATYYDDLDGDGFGDPAARVDGCAPPAGAVPYGSDCDDGDPDTWGAPSEVRDVGMQSAATLIWASPSAPGGSVVLYDVIRSDDPTDFVNGAACVATDISATTTDDVAVPPLGSVYIYLIRAGSGCPVGGSGSLGAGTSGIPRVGLSCP
jgi:N-acetylneuraminic acid mutarotase